MAGVDGTLDRAEYVAGTRRRGTVRERRRHISVARRTALSGALFSVLFVVGLALVTAWTPLYSSPDLVWVAWYEDGWNQARQLVGLLLMVASSFAFIVFVIGFLRVSDDEDGRSWFSWVAVAAAVAFATMAILGSMALAAVSLVVASVPDISATPDADVLRFLNQVGVAMLLGLGGGWSAAVCIAALSVRVRRSGVLPRRLATAGFISAVLLLAAPTFVPLVLLVLWVVVASVALQRIWLASTASDVDRDKDIRSWPFSERTEAFKVKAKHGGGP